MTSRATERTMSQGKPIPSEASSSSRPARLCVLFDASPGSLAALELAINARRPDQPLEVLYLDEPDWQRSAVYPFAAEICGLSGQLRPHHPESASWRQQHGQARARRALQQRLSALGLAADWRVCHHHQLDDWLAGLDAADCLALGRVGYAEQQGRQVGKLVRRLVEQSRASLLLPARGSPPAPRSVAVLLDMADRPDWQATLVDQARARAAALGLSLLLIGQAQSDPLAGPAECYRPNYTTGSAGQAELARVLRARRAAELFISRRGRWMGSTQGLARLAALPVTLRVMA